MKRLILILILIFNFQLFAKAEDIREFEIEGISIGGSLLNIVSKLEIENNKDFKHPNKKYYNYLYLDKKNSKYDFFQFAIMDGDKNYIIEDLSVGIYFKNNIKGCLKQMDEVINDVTSSFPNLRKTKKQTRKHRGDPSGKTIITEIYFNFKAGDVIAVQCTDYSKELKYHDGLSIDLASAKYYDWMHDEAFK